MCGIRTRQMCSESGLPGLGHVFRLTRPHADAGVSLKGRATFFIPSCIDASAKDALASRSFSNTFTSKAIDACIQIQVTSGAAGATKKRRQHWSPWVAKDPPNLKFHTTRTSVKNTVPDITPGLFLTESNREHHRETASSCRSVSCDANE